MRHERFEDMGTVAVGRGVVRFEDVCIPENHLLGKEGKGFSQVMQGFDFSRALIGLQCIGPAQVTVEETWEYVTHREAFDQPLSKFQGVSFPLPKSRETLLAAARLLCYQTLWLKEQRDAPYGTGGNVQVVGPEGILRSHPGLHPTAWTGRLQDRTTAGAAPAGRAGTADGDGTAQIMKLIIARQRIGRALAP